MNSLIILYNNKFKSKPFYKKKNKPQKGDCDFIKINII